MKKIYIFYIEKFLNLNFAILKIDKKAASSEEVICIPQKNYNLDIGFPSGTKSVFSAGWNIAKEGVSNKRAVEGKS